MTYTSLDQLINRARESGKSKRVVAVVAAQDSHTLEAVSQAVKDNIVAAILIGPEKKNKRPASSAWGESAGL